MRPRVPRASQPAYNVLGAVSSRNADVDPAELIEILCSLDVIGEHGWIGAVMVAVVFCRQLDALPTHVEVIPPTTVRAQHRNLRPGSRGSSANYQEPQPRFRWRLCARIHEVQRDLELTQTTGTTMVTSQVCDVRRFEARNCGKSVEPRDGGTETAPLPRSNAVRSGVVS